MPDRIDWSSRDPNPAEYLVPPANPVHQIGWGALGRQGALLKATRIYRLSVLALAILASPVSAQTVSSNREEIFEAMLADPANEALMREYARLSVEERDYEAAASTLERLVDIAPDAQEARYELALAYFALGANEVARYHLDIYKSRGQLSAEEEAAADAFISGVDNRENPLSFSGSFEAGVVSNSDDNNVGAAVDLRLDFDYRLDTASPTVWETTVRLRGFIFPGDSDDNQGVFRIRTGPEFSLDGTAFGPRLKPYLEYQYIEDDDDEDAGQSLGLGLEYSQLLASGVTVEASVERGKIDRKNIAEDSDFSQVRVGASYRAQPDLTLGLWARYLNEDFDGVEDDRERYGVRLGIRKGFGEAFLGMQDWSVSGFLRLEKEDFDSGRSDDLNSAGVSVKSYFRPNSYIRTSLSVFDRDSSFNVFDDTDTFFSLEAGVEF